MRAWRGAVLAGVVASHGACATAASTGPVETPVTVAVETQDRAGASALWKRLASEPLAGLALVWHDTVLYPTAAAARAAAPERRHDGDGVRAVHILADEGDVVKVRTWLSPRVRAGMTALTGHDLTLYATREQLVPVLREVVQEDLADGSGYLLLEGLPLAIEKVAQPLDRRLEGLEQTLDPNAVSLSFPLSGKDPSFASGARGEEVACRYEQRRSAWDPLSPVEERRTEIVGIEAHRAEKLAEARARAPYRDGPPLWAPSLDLLHEQPSCSLIGPSGEGDADPAVMLDGKPFMKARDVPGDRCGFGVRAFRAPANDRYLIELSMGRALLRVTVPEAALVPSGGCGGGGMIGGYGVRGRGRAAPPPTKQVPMVRGKVKVYFPDGTHAGYQLHGTTRLEGEPLIEGRPCVEHPNVSTRICFDPADVEQVQVPR